MMLVNAPNILEIFLEQPRRGKTHEVQLTLHKRCAMWGVILLFLVTTGSAQTLKKATPEQSKKMVETINKATASV